jgi:uncharacterized protein (DUF2141 family)
MLSILQLPACPTLLSLLLTISSSAFPTGQPPTLTIAILNVQKNSGSLVVEVYQDQASWLKTPFRRLTLPSNETTKTAALTLPPGRYAVSIYQDTNGNGKLDQNLLSIAKEPVGFGNNYRPFGKPSFDAAALDHTATSQPAAIKLFTVF